MGAINHPPIEVVELHNWILSIQFTALFAFAIQFMRARRTCHHHYHYLPGPLPITRVSLRLSTYRVRYVIPRSITGNWEGARGNSWTLRGRRRNKKSPSLIKFDISKLLLFFNIFHKNYPLAVILITKRGHLGVLGGLVGDRN